MIMPLPIKQAYTQINPNFCCFAYSQQILHSQPPMALSTCSFPNLYICIGVLTHIYLWGIFPIRKTPLQLTLNFVFSQFSILKNLLWRCTQGNLILCKDHLLFWNINNCTVFAFWDFTLPLQFPTENLLSPVDFSLALSYYWL